MSMVKCDICQRQYDAKHGHECQPMHYKPVLPGMTCDLSYVGVCEAASQCGDASVYYLYVNPEDVVIARSVAKHCVNLCSFWVNVLPRPGLKRGEWCVAANGEFFGSMGVI
jgi:hypothetical protein